MRPLNTITDFAFVLPALLVAGLLLPAETYWPPLIGNVTWGFGVLGIAASLFVFSRICDAVWLLAVLGLLITAGCFIAAGLMLWPVITFIPGYWQATPCDYYSTFIEAVIVGVKFFFSFLGSYITFLNNNAPWALTSVIPGLGSILLAFTAIRWLLFQPVLSGFTGNRDTASGPWAGSWMAPARVRDLTRNRSGLPLGISGRRIVRYEPNSRREWLPGHHMVVAGTRAGKGVACVIPAIIDHDGPVVAIDIKGENFAICRRYRQSLGRRQIVLNPFHLIEDRTSHYDPLTYLRPAHLQRDISTLCDGLIKPESAPETAWISNGARDTLEAAVELVMTTADKNDRTLLTVANLVLAPNRLETFAAWAEAGNLCNGRIAQAGAKITQMGDRQQGAVLDCLSENLSWLKFDQVRTMLGKSDFQLDDLLDNKIDLYLVVPQDMTQNLANFMRLMMTLALGAVTRQDGRRQVAAKILAVLDEFTRLGRMEKVMEIATIAAGGGVEAVFVVQDRGTLDKIYTPDGATTLLGSCATTRIFGLGRADDKTARWAENQLPFKTVIRESQSHRDAKKDVSRSESKERLMDGPAIQEMPANQMLCLIRSNQPLRLKQIISHKHPAYRDKLDPNPVARA